MRKASTPAERSPNRPLGNAAHEAHYSLEHPFGHGLDGYSEGKLSLHTQCDHSRLKAEQLARDSRNLLCFYHSCYSDRAIIATILIYAFSPGLASHNVTASVVRSLRFGGYRRSHWGACTRIGGKESKAT
jgi:hypothetical protein